MTRSGEFDPSIPAHIVIFRSWKSMKTWVMTWLWALNAVYWPAFFWLDRVEARYAALAYVAVLPLAIMIIVPQRGLTRLSGLMHLPFLALLIWLAPRLTATEFDGMYGIWLQVLFWCTAVCVAFDILDVAKWLKGERYRLGTPEAVRMGASKTALNT